jgi:glycosyltransferase involved in cell wall biosynthesis
MDDQALNVLYLSYDGMTDPLGQSQVLPYLRELSKEGYNIHLVSFEKPDKFRQHHKHIQAICDTAGIHWHPQDYVLGGSLLTTLKQVRRMKKIAFYLHERYHFQLVHCRSYIAALSGLALKRKQGVGFIFDMRGFWADERVDGGLWRLKNPIYNLIYRYFKRREIEFLLESDHIVSLTHSGKQEIESWPALKGKTLSIEVIPCCVDLALFDPEKFSEADKKATLAEFGLGASDYLLGYIGSIGTWYMLPEMLAYFKELKAVKPEAKFLFITGEKAQNIKDQAATLGIAPEDILCVSVLHRDVPRYISVLDASIFFIRPSYSKKASSPTKQGEIMAMGIPLVCNSQVGDTDRIVEEYQAGYVVEDMHPEAYRKILAKEGVFDPRRIHEGAQAYFSLAGGVASYLKVYRKVHG